MLRYANWLAFSALVIGVMPEGARADSCTSDDDCARGSWCVIANGGGTVDCPPDAKCPIAGQDDSPAATEGSCEPLPRGACEDEADCSDGLDCLKPDISAPDCPAAPPGEEPTDCDPSGAPPAPARYGYCSLPETQCSADSDCMFGLSCVTGASGGGTSGGSGGVDPVDPAPAPGPVDKDGSGDGICAFEPRSCDGGEACPDGFECVAVETSGSCTSTACPDGVPCDPAPEPECETNTEKLCVPKLIPCSDTAPCEEHWTCTELTTDGSGIPAPESWGASGTVNSCLPEGLALAAEAGEAGSLSSNDVATDAPREGGAGQASGDESAHDDDGGKSAGSSSSCSVIHRTRAQGALGVLFTLSVMGLLVGRRRRSF